MDPLKCPKCQGTMKIISFIEEPDVIRKILVHLDLWDLWDLWNHDPPIKKPVQISELTYDESSAQPSFEDVWVQ